MAERRIPPEADAVIIQRLNDLAWLPFLGIICTLMMQQLLIAWAILQDRRPNPPFPRWAGYFNVWMAFMVAPASLIPFFKTGPFAWNGLLARWVAVASFFVWMVVTIGVLLRAIGRSTSEVESSDPAVEALSREVADLRRRLDLIDDSEVPSGGGGSRPTP